MKLFIQIPCYNEEATLPLVVNSIPRAIPGVDEVRVLVVNDGSTDRTVDVARELGVDYIVSHRGNRGLAATFQTGLDTCLQLGADIIVNTDGDNQYPQAEIPRLIAPILRGEADMVVADRQTDQISHFSAQKKLLQRAGSWMVRRLAGAQVADAPSGFRAFTREVAERLNVVSTYSYTLDTLIQVGRSNLKIANVPVTTNPKTRESRLMRGTIDYVVNSSATLLRVHLMYESLRWFIVVGSGAMFIGALFIARWMIYYFQGEGEGKVQSLVLATMLFVVGFVTCSMGLLANLIGSNRRLLEMLLYRVKRIERAQVPTEAEDVADVAEQSASPVVTVASSSEAEADEPLLERAEEPVVR
jgi:glycosyltransferase involved in cell wall biosynthesis